MSDHKQGVIFTAPDGAIYHVPGEELEKFKVPAEKVEQTILEAESHGFVDVPQEDNSSCEESIGAEAEEALPQATAPAAGGTVINIFLGGNSPVVESVRAAAPDAEPAAAGSTMSKYAAGSTMSKYAAGSTAAPGATMSKYAAGSTMSKYAAGSTAAPGATMSKYAAGSTMSKYAAGSTAAPGATMSKYAAGSTMSKYAAGSTMLAGGGSAGATTTFYGSWTNGEKK